MPKFIQRFIRWLYISFVDPDVSALVREQLLLSSRTIDLDDMEGEGRANFLRDCASIYNSDVFGKVLEDLTIKQKDFTMLEGKQTDQFLAGRLCIYGVSTVREAFKSYNSKYQDLKKTGQDYDPFRVL